MRLAPVAIALVLAACATGQSRRAVVVDLDNLLAFARPETCERSPQHEAFMNAMVRIDNETVYPGRIAASHALSAAFGPIQYRRADGYQVVSTSVSGRWLGMRLLEISQSFPEGGDPGDFHFVLDVPLEQVRERLRAAGFPVTTQEMISLPDSDGYEHSLTLARSPANADHTIFGCGWN
ncbi:hypothetical protein [Sphingosinicella microcystinivorans]|uniref:hypothetical protein n=1 Tax=Sphingosinicella microcystinivorans TaxID=335406 RepID=UPI0011AE2CA1|nr:hypothetical protein [Sphingosinicella microcystinivorans]